MAIALPTHLLVQWHITERCNLRCAHCYQESSPSLEPSLAQLMTVLDRIEDFVAWVRRASRRPVPVHLTLTGGEPFLHPGVRPLLERLAARRTRWTLAVLTNGSLLDEDLVDALRLLHLAFVQVSIEGTEATHDRIRGRGSFALATRALLLLTQRGIPSCVAFTAHRDNAVEFPAVAALARKLRVTRLWADRLVPLGNAAHTGAQPLTPLETRDFVQSLQNERTRRTRSRTEIAMHRALQFLIAGGTPYRCSAGDTLLTILPNGELCPCRRLPLPVGNVLERPLRELYLESPVLRSLREHDAPPDPCAACFYSRLCRGGLRCLAHAVHGTPFAADPGCWLAAPAATGPAAPLLTSPVSCCACPGT